MFADARQKTLIPNALEHRFDLFQRVHLLAQDEVDERSVVPAQTDGKRRLIVPSALQIRSQSGHHFQAFEIAISAEHAHQVTASVVFVVDQVAVAVGLVNVADQLTILCWSR